MNISSYIAAFDEFFPGIKQSPWHFIRDIQPYLESYKAFVTDDFTISRTAIVHKSAIVEQGVVLKGPVFISKGVFIGAHSYLRGGVFLADDVSIGPGCELKSSVVMPRSALAHFNFIGDSIVGSDVNMEAGSIAANHHNDRKDKTILVLDGTALVRTDVVKFGALVGDGSKIGANAVLSPGTILKKNSIVNRLELIRQN